MSTPSLTLDSLTNISFSKLYKFFTHRPIVPELPLSEFIRGADTYVYDVEDNANIPNTKTNIELRNFLNAISILTEDIVVTNPDTYITTKLLEDTTYINNFNLYDYIETLDIYNIKTNIYELTITLDIHGYQFVDNTSNGAFVINMDKFTTDFPKLTKITINNNMLITGKHGTGAGTSTSPASSINNGGTGESGTNGNAAVVINSTFSSTITVEINDVHQKIIGGFGAQGGNGGDGGTETIYLYRSYDGSAALVSGSIILYNVRENFVEPFVYTNIELTDNDVAQYNDNTAHIIGANKHPFYGSGFKINSANNTYDYYETQIFERSGEVASKIFTGQFARNGGYAVKPLIGVHHAENLFTRNTPIKGTDGPTVDGVIFFSSIGGTYVQWTYNGGNPGGNGTNGDIYTHNDEHITFSLNTS